MELDAEDEQQNKNEDFLVVGLGASAGGLEALEAFFEALPDSPGMAFVVIIHLSPDHESSMAELLQDHTPLQVSQITEQTQVKPNHVYVIPPGKLLSMEDQHLVLSEADKKDKKLTTIDLFFRSLGKAMGAYSGCIILSGAGSDGTIGLKTIKEHGGIVITQTPEEADFDSMPYNAVQTGLVDITVTAKEIPKKLREYQESLRQIKISDSTELPESDTEILDKIFEKVNVKMGHDFTQYKRASVLRRIERRMRVNRINSLSNYLKYITEHPSEIEELFKDLLISVTNFFRDPEAFETLQETTIPKLFEGKNSKDSVRVWVPGCATGEEAYSLAILLHEHAQTLNKPPNIKIFATDIDKEALDSARRGFYPETIAADITKKRLAKYFNKEGSEYRIKRNISSMILFAAHNLLKDPPFSKLDLISCRNLLIYLNRDLQSEVFNLFHYALKPEKWLFLGMSDSILEADDLFNTIDKKHQIYQQSKVSKSQIRLPRYPLSRENESPSSHRRSVRYNKKQSNIEDLHHRLLFKQYEPTSVIINSNYEVLHSTSDIDRFLKYSGGEPSQKILDMILPDLRKVISRLLFQAKEEEDITPTSQKVKLNIEGTFRYYKIMVRKITDPNFPEGLLQLTFMKDPDTDSDHPKPNENVESASAEDTDIISALENELEHTKEQLHVTIEEYETSNEELQASNEELQSMNEELKSTTEQLETSKEELESVNEELERKVEKLNEANSNLKNLMEATDIATLFIDSDNCIQFFTSSATDLFNLIAPDKGRPFKHVTHKLNYDSIQADIEQVTESLQPIKKIVPDDSGNQYIMRLRPYRTINDKIDGVVLTFVDITQLKKVEKKLEREIERSTDLQKEILNNSLTERWELGEYLHDNLAQVLASIKIKINNIKNDLSETSQPDITSTLNEINNLIDEEIDSIRDLSHDIIPIDVEKEGVSHAFNLLIRRSKEIYDTKCIFETDGVLDKITNREFSTNLYHITQEVIKNAAIHGEANRILVIAGEQEGQLLLNIKDNGTGFLPEDDNKGMGLRIIEHRVELLEGTFTVDRLSDSEDFTTHVRCTFPVKAIME